MAMERPKERKRARKGLGARSAAGESIPATPEGRHPRPDDTRVTSSKVQARSRGPRAEEARRRTREDNPDRP